jgi:hypothetical protein
VRHFLSQAVTTHRVRFKLRNKLLRYALAAGGDIAVKPSKTSLANAARPKSLRASGGDQIDPLPFVIPFRIVEAVAGHSPLASQHVRVKRPNPPAKP